MAARIRGGRGVIDPIRPPESVVPLLGQPRPSRPRRVPNWPTIREKISESNSQTKFVESR